MFRLGQHVTVEEFYKYAPLGMELSRTICDDDCDLEYEDYEYPCENNQYVITLRYYLADFPDTVSYRDEYIEHFPPDLTLKPGFIWDSSEYGVEQLYSWSSIPNDFVVHKLPKIKILKRKEL